MNDEVERHRLIRDALELELQALRHRLLTVENFSENVDSENMNPEQAENLISRYRLLSHINSIFLLLIYLKFEEIILIQATAE